MSHQQSQLVPVAEHLPLGHQAKQSKRLVSTLEAPTMVVGIIVARPTTSKPAASVVEMRIASSLGEVEATAANGNTQRANRRLGCMSDTADRCARL